MLGVGSAFVLVAGAEPIVAFLGGVEFEPTVAVLRIQGLAVAATFLVTLFAYMLWVVRARRQLVLCNLLGLGAAVVLTATLIPAWEAKGAAIAMLIAESLLAVSLGIALFRRRANLRPSVRTPIKAIVAVGVAASFALAPISPLASVILGSAAYVAALLILRAIPLEVLRHAFGGGGQMTRLIQFAMNRALSQPYSGRPERYDVLALEDENAPLAEYSAKSETREQRE